MLFRSEYIYVIGASTSTCWGSAGAGIFECWDMCGQPCMSEWGIESGGVEVKNRGADSLVTWRLHIY